MATEPESTFNFINTIKGWTPVAISSAALIWSFVNHRLTKKNNLKYLLLETRLQGINQQRHWRREKVYNLADEIFNLSANYWLQPGRTDNIKRIELDIKVRLQDIEDNATAIDIDISNEVSKLSHHVTGGSFESPEREALDPSHEKFLYIRQATQDIKAKLN